MELGPVVVGNPWQACTNGHGKGGCGEVVCSEIVLVDAPGYM